MPTSKASSSAKEKIHVPFIMTQIEENFSWKVWSDNLINRYSQVDAWVIGDLSGKIWAQSYRSNQMMDDEPQTVSASVPDESSPISAVVESETQKAINAVKNQLLVRSTGITIGGQYFGFVQGNNINTATFRSDKGCVGVSLLRNNYLIAISFSGESFPPRFYEQIANASKSVKLLWY